MSAREVAPRATGEGGVPLGARSVSVFLVNRRPQAPDETRDTAFAFQAQIELTSEVPLVSRPGPPGVSKPRMGRACRRSAVPRCWRVRCRPWGIDRSRCQ